jgi:hypothetical protein
VLDAWSQPTRTISSILDDARGGRHPSCRDCPWNPGLVGAVAFGQSCRTHGVDWERHPARAVSLQVVQDPGGTTPEKTGKLCFACNSHNPTDRTAQHNYDLWRGAVALRWERPALEDHASEGFRHLRHHYWANAAMHGAPAGPLRQHLPGASRACSRIIEEQVRSLRPRVIIASGQVASETLRRLGYVSETWLQIRAAFDRGPFESSAHHKPWPDGSRLTVFCTYHTSIRTVNTAAARLYEPHYTERRIAEATTALGTTEATQRFLDEYAHTEKATHRGMRVLLLHWLRIGSRIREVVDRDTDP